MDSASITQGALPHPSARRDVETFESHGKGWGS